MNSLNILSSRVIGTGSSLASNRPRSRSQGELLPSGQSTDLPRGRSFSDRNLPQSSDVLIKKEEAEEAVSPAIADLEDEKTPLFEHQQDTRQSKSQSKLRSIAKKIVDALTESLKLILSTLVAPGVYIITCFRDDDGRYSPFIPVKKISRCLAVRKSSTSTASAVGLSAADGGIKMDPEKTLTRRNGEAIPKLKSSASRESMSSTTSESDALERKRSKAPSSEGRPTRSKPNMPASGEEIAPARRSIRLKLHNEDSLKRRKQRKNTNDTTSSTTSSNPLGCSPAELTIATLKSPTSPSSSLKVTKYPHAPVAPHPLIPRRQPSYSTLPRSNSHLAQKTLVIDLDETLIHSLAKGGRMSSGHMVEVKLNMPVGLSPGSPNILGPQHPILYYVHKRPHCDDFLRKICKWYKLVVFTASVQEYADPVIDWLEQERKFFVGRYYRQHCTFRNGAYIKDLSSVEPDLSRVMILDNSPMSYIFHEDNAIPIEGWINDPTDNDLLHLIPVLEALQYVTDVRALLALRRGEAGT